MLDIKRIKENPEEAKARLATRQKNYDAEIDRLMALDVERRALIAEKRIPKLLGHFPILFPPCTHRIHVMSRSRAD